MQSKTDHSSYQVIARKWRPGAFKEVVGQDHVVRTLSNAVDSGRIGHAFIFSGPRGVGKTTIARILAKCLNCAEGPTSEPCLKCNNCTGITGGSLVDVLEIDGASNNSVENVRELCESVRYAPASARYKIYIIDEVHMLSTSAFNALLKTLEEPPPHVVFIFATTEPQKIPLTIHSRCQRFDFRRIPLKQIISHLTAIAAKEGIDATPEAIFMVSREADGSLRDAQSLLEQVISFSGNKLTEADIRDSLGLMDRSIIFELSGAVLDGDGGVVLNIVEKIHEFGYDFKKVTAELLEHIRDLVVVKVSGAALLELPGSEVERLTSLAGQAGVERLETLFGLFTGGYNEVARSTTPRFAFEMMLVRATLLEDLRPIGELIAGLEKLQKGGGSRGGGSVGGQRQIKRASVNKTVGPVPSKTLNIDKVDTSGRVPASTLAEKPPRLPDEPIGEESKRSTSGLLAFIEGSDMLIYNHLKAARLQLEGGTLKITASQGDVNFLQYVKKDALVGICRDYFKNGIRLEFEKGDGAAVPPKVTAPRAAAQDMPPVPDRTVVADIPEPPVSSVSPAYDEPESFPAPESFSSIDEAPLAAEVTADKEEKPAVVVAEDPGGKSPERVAESNSEDGTVLKDALSALGGEVIA